MLLFIFYNLNPIRWLQSYHRKLCVLGIFSYMFFDDHFSSEFVKKCQFFGISIFPVVNVDPLNCPILILSQKPSWRIHHQWWKNHVKYFGLRNKLMWFFMALAASMNNFWILVLADINFSLVFFACNKISNNLGLSFRCWDYFHSFFRLILKIF